MSLSSRATLLTFFGSVVAVTPLVGLMIAACSDSSSRPPVLGDHDSAVQIHDDGSIPFDGPIASNDSAVPDDGGADGPTLPDGAPLICNTLPAEGPLVPQTMLGGSQPAALGGLLFSGTYWLTERDSYMGPADAVFVQRSLLIDTSTTTVNTVEGTTTTDAGVPALTMTTSTYTVTDMINLSTTETCPGPVHTTNVFYTAVGGKLTLYPTPDTVEVYILQ